MATKVICNNYYPAATIYHSTDENVSRSQLVTEGHAYAKEHYLGRKCTLVVHRNPTEGDHVHVIVKE